MDMPKLKLPPRGFTMDDSFECAKQKGTLSHIVAETITEQNKKLKITYKKGDSERQQLVKACAAFNKSFQETRELIDVRVQKYLLDHGGEAGSWPDCTSLSDIELNYSTESLLEFDYFGDEYVVSDTVPTLPFLRRKSEDFIYRNTYKAQDSPAFSEEAQREKELRKALDRAKEDRSVVLPVLTLLAALYLLFALANWVGNDLWGTDETILKHMLQTIKGVNLGGVLGSLRDALCSALNFPSWLSIKAYENFRKGYDVLMLFLCAAVAVGAFFTGGMTCYFIKANWVYAQAKRQYERFVSRESYKNSAAENAQWQEKAQALSDEWHQAWFKWAQIHKGRVGLTHLDWLMEQSRASEHPEKEKEMREQVRNDLGLAIPEDFNALLWWKRFDQRTDALVQEYAESGEKSFDELPNPARTLLTTQATREMVEQGLAEYIN